MNQPIRRKKLHKTTFFLAGLYNICWGIYGAVDPQWFFRLTELPETNHPEIFACLAMVVGVYGILYLEVARKPESGFPIAAVGLLGKILGPIGWAYLYFAGKWPLISIVLIFINDLIWWIPFLIYLWDSKDEYFKSYKNLE